MNAPPKAFKQAMAGSDFLTAALCENLMAGRDPFAGFPGTDAAALRARASNLDKRNG